MNAALTETLVDIARRAQAAPHGRRTEIYTAAAQELGMSVQTLLRKLKTVAVRPPRRRRSDAGQCALPRDEALTISAYLMEATRRNGKRLAKLAAAVEVLRSNGLIVAGRVDERTGEFFPLSESAIGRALYGYGLHPDQLGRPAPKIALASRHPNHVWQIDPSLCVLYYLRAGQRSRGLQVMEADRFYKNKPLNAARIANDRVWRYVFTDHASGAFYVEYVLGAESGANLAATFINAIQARGSGDPFHGVPLLVMVDPGSANTGAVFKNLCAALSVEVWVNQPGQPWAKGQVEKTNDLIEREFEQGLKFIDVPDLATLNSHAWRWMRKHNGTAIHSRTRRSRYAVWQTITPEQLRIAPGVDVCRELAVSAPESRVVTPQLTVSYRGTDFDVSTVPGVMVGEKLMLTRNPWRDADSAQVVLTGADGRPLFHIVEALRYGEFGFRADAAMIGERYKRHADTPAQKARKEIEQLVMQADSPDAAAAKRKRKALPFDGRIDPYKPVTDTPLPDYLPRRGTELDVPRPYIETPLLTHVQAAKRIKALLGDAWSADSYPWLERHYPEGVPDEDAVLERIATELRATDKPALRVVGE